MRSFAGVSVLLFGLPSSDVKLIQNATYDLKCTINMVTDESAERKVWMTSYIYCGTSKYVCRSRRNSLRRS